MRRLAIAVAALCAFAPSAQARFASLPQQPPGDVVAFAASGKTWLALLSALSGAAPYVSRDGGVTWQQVPLNNVTYAYPEDQIAVAPDGAFWLAVGESGGAALMRMGREGQAFEPVFRVPAGDSFPRLSVPAWDGQGRPWAGSSSNGGEVLRIAPDGTVAESLPVKGTHSSPNRVGFFGGRLYADFSNFTLFHASGGAMVPVDSSSGGPQVGFPLLVSGRSVLTESGLSIDGGDTFGSRFLNVREVTGSDRLVRQLAFSGSGDGGRIMARSGRSFLVPTGLVLPVGTTSVSQIDDGLLTVADGALQVHGGSVPKLTAPGRLRGIARTMLNRANHFRRLAGMPPLLGSPGITHASRNHALYWARRGLNFRSLTLNAHSEQRGTRGFTGATPSERCAHVGAVCGGEVINFGNQSQRPVDSWIATPFHRAPFIDPANALAGAARVGRVGVMNFSSELQNVALDAIRFPQGRYDGPLAFPGNEVPDPLAACRAVGQPLRGVPSTPVSFVPPVATPKVPVIEVFQAGRRLPGCTKAGFFMGRAPLRPHTRYTARVRWVASPNGPVLTTKWVFRTR